MRIRICLILVLLGLLVPAGTATAEPPRTVAVTGTATLQVPNDLATFRFGIEATRRSSSAALSAAAVRTRAVIAAMGPLGIAPADVTTGQTTVERVTRLLRPGSTVRVVEYIARASVVVMVRNVPIAGQVSTAAVAAGATSVSGPSFTASDPSETARQALAAAFADAQAKAARLAAAAGVDLGGPLTIREGVDVSTPNQPASQEAPDSGTARPRTPPPTRPGTSTVTANVSVVFEID